MNLIMNEKNEAERIINSGDINTDTGAKLSLLARYYAYAVSYTHLTLPTKLEV